MPQTIVLAFSTLDGIFEDPDGSGGTPHGGWVFRDGPPPPDHFRLGPKLDTGVLLLGGKTWELFSHIWPARTDDFSMAMNRMPKLVASRTRTDLSAWENSSLMSGELLDAVERAKADRDVIIAGSASIVHALAEHDRVDEYRILFFPTALGDGIPLFSPKAAPVQLRLLSAEASGPAIFARYERFAR
ncbi:MAG: dihydrofolate reductase family protein [Streptosporangiaceae bacterium]